ncbi:MAG: hypothetical protein R8M71_02085 [Alphaproteobacteria bacterium]|nr:hypothetical protein [Alphaproteobacteria bacterium]
MQFYKKAFLTLSVAGAMVSCAPVSLMTYPVQAKVIEKANFIYLDYDNDGIADARMYIRGYTVKNNQWFFKDYILVGDTLKYRTTEDNPVNLDADLYQNVILDSVNNRSADDLRRIYQINFMRESIGQEKVR